MSIFSKLFDSNEKQINKLQVLIDQINSFENEFESLLEDDFKSKTKGWQESLSKLSEDEQENYLNKILPEAYALVKEATKRKLGLRAHDVQLIAAIVLHQGKIAEQKTGEGKTLTAVFPLYLNALTRRGCHLITPNDYLSQIGSGWMGPIYQMLGLRVSTIIHDQAFIFDYEYKDESAFDSRLVNLRPISRQKAYEADITYGTNNELGFDYLRDNMVWDVTQMVQTNPLHNWGEHHYAIVDEVDFILIDEARTPLIISAPAEDSTQKYYEFARIISKLSAETDYTTEEKTKSASLTEEGIQKLEKWLKVDNLYEKDFQTLHHIEQALRANVMYENDKDYIVKNGEVVIVDEFTGRLMEGRRYSEGLHQSIEAKEKVEIKKESKTLATISFQNYFRMYTKLAGMTGTAVTEAEEFNTIYGLDVITIPTDKPVIRKDNADYIYKTGEAKYNAVIEEIKERHKTGQPILIGTTSIANNELLSQMLERKGVKHNLLNAKQHEREAQILAQAGEKDSVTVATNMAGRGVDIELGGRKPDRFLIKEHDKEALAYYHQAVNNWQEKHDEVVALGGLYVIGTARHEARRIDNQLRGRAGRQGDPGESRFYVSLEDDLMRIFGGEQVKKIMEMMNIPDDMPIEHTMVSKALEKSQTRVEGHNFDIRKHLVDYDDVMNKQREIIYKRRRKALEEGNKKQEGEQEEKVSLRERISSMVKREIETMVLTHLTEGRFDYTSIVKEFSAVIPFNDTSKNQIEKDISSFNQETEIIEKLQKIAQQTYEQREQELGEQTIRGIEKFVTLSTIDNLWQLHLTDIDHLRNGIGLQGYGQRDPLVEYKSEAFKLFEQLIGRIDSEIVNRIYRVSVAQKKIPTTQIKEIKPEVTTIARETGSNEISPASRADQARKKITPVKVEHKVGRNDPCPCGSGKKYKKCHGS